MFLLRTFLIFSLLTPNLGFSFYYQSPQKNNINLIDFESIEEGRPQPKIICEFEIGENQPTVCYISYQASDFDPMNELEP